MKYIYCLRWSWCMLCEPRHSTEQDPYIRCGRLVANKFGESHIKIVTNELVLLLLVYQFICKEMDNRTSVVRETCYSNRTAWRRKKKIMTRHTTIHFKNRLDRFAHILTQTGPLLWIIVTEKYNIKLKFQNEKWWKQVIVSSWSIKWKILK